MPLVNEWRIFILNSKVIAKIPYWSNADYSSISEPDFNIPNLNIPFYTIDVARKASGEWIIIEIGDGGSSAIPEHYCPFYFYNSLKLENTIV